MKNTTLLLIGLCIFLSAFSQQNNEKIKVFFDCNRGWLCDFDYIRTELKMVDFVRDRFQSDVHVLFTTEYTTNGGEKNQMEFIGQTRFTGLVDTLKYFNEATFTDDDKRKQIVHYLKLGLTRYIAKTGLAKNIEINFSADSGSAVKPTVQKDRWNYWTFNVGLSGFLNKNQTYDYKNINGYFNASRETEEMLTSFNFNHSYNRETDFISDTEVVKINRDRTRLFAGIYKKLTEHCALGTESGFSAQPYENFDARIFITPSFEYSLLPYKKFNSERIVFQYGLGVEYSNYQDTTIYFKTEEWQAKQIASIITSFTKPWGSINFGCFWSNYLEDFSKNNLGISGAVSWNIFKGFQFSLFGSYSFIRDQINLPKEGATRDDVLTRRRLIASDYEFNFGMGFSYRFGSVFNSAVHQTFKGLNYNINF